MDANLPEKLTDAHLDELAKKEYVIVPDYYAGSQLSEMQAALHERFAKRFSLQPTDRVKNFVLPFLHHHLDECRLSSSERVA